LVSMYAALFVVAEAASVLSTVEVSLVCNAALLIALLNHATFGRPDPAVQRALSALAVVSALRIATIVGPQDAIDETYWDAVAAFIALSLIAGLYRAQVAILPLLRDRSLAGGLGQTAVALSGLVLADAARVVCVPAEPGIDGRYAVAVVAALSGIALEVVFRGVLQPSLMAIFGWSAVGLTTLVYTSFFIATGSAQLAFVALVTGAFWGAAAAITGSVGGVVLSHVLFSVGWSVGMPGIVS
jgi:membrane protease YdiL (CAAX protease family)